MPARQWLIVPVKSTGRRFSAPNQIAQNDGHASEMTSVITIPKIAPHAPAAPPCPAANGLLGCSATHTFIFS